jgi:hypothetical protein
VVLTYAPGHHMKTSTLIEAGEFKTKCVGLLDSVARARRSAWLGSVLLRSEASM